MSAKDAIEGPSLRPDPEDNLRYVCDMLEQLKALSGNSGGPFLSYLIDMARMEAAGRIEQIGRPRAGSGQKGDPAA